MVLYFYIWGKFFFIRSEIFHHSYLWIIFLELGKLYNHRNDYPDTSQDEGEQNKRVQADKGKICRFRASELEAGREERVCRGGQCW